jgi:hypothetical protein
MIVSANTFTQLNQAILDDEGTRKEMVKAIYTVMRDEYDWIYMVQNNAQLPQTVPNLAMHYTVKQDVGGIGGAQFDGSADYGSAGKLKGIINLRRASDLVTGPFLHETMHQWGSMDFLGNNMHWDGSTDACGQIGGSCYDDFDLTNVTTVTLDGKEYPTDKLKIKQQLPPRPETFSNVELYLMGLISAQEAGALWHAIIDWGASGLQYADCCSPGQEYVISHFYYSTMEQAQEYLYGPRIPDYQNSQKDFRALAVMLTPASLTEEEIQWFTDDTVTAADAFKRATGDRATLTFSGVDGHGK